MKWAVIVVRTLVGLPFFVLGLNHFLNLFPMPQPETFPQAAKDWGKLMTESHYMSAVKVVEVVGGLLLLTGRVAPLGLTLLTPVIVNILLFEVFLIGTPGGGVVLLALAVFLIWAYRSYFAPLFTTNAKIGS